MHSAARLDTLGTEQAYVVLAAAKRLEAAGHKVVHLEIGEPDMPTPPHVVEAGVRALRDGLTRYALAAGVPELRDAIARSLAARGVRATAENVVVTPGAKPALFCTALSVKIGRAHVWNSSHLVISYAVFCLKKKKPNPCSGSNRGNRARRGTRSSRSPRCGDPSLRPARRRRMRATQDRRAARLPRAAHCGTF